MVPPENSAASGNSTATVDGGFRHWNSPIPYLFGGLALMLGLITMALLILACSYRKSSLAPNSGGATNSTTAEETKPAAQVDVVVGSDEPKIVVIMAGDDTPTYLAKPVVYSNSLHDHHTALE